MSNTEIPNLDVNLRALSDLCLRYGVKELAIFGSILRKDFSHTSDIDVLVEFVDGKCYTLLDLAGLHLDLEDLLAHKVDLVEKKSVKLFLAEEILSSRRVVYDETH